MSTKKIVLITGANSGIGFELASQLLADASMHILLGSRSAEKGEAAIATLKSRNQPGAVEMLQVDVSSEDSIRAAAASVEKTHGRLDALVNNAAVGLAGLESMGADMMQSFQTNVVGPQLMIDYFVPLLRKAAGTPRIINVTSGGGSIQILLTPDSISRRYRAVPYQVSKAALNMVTAQAFVALHDDGIKVFLYCPGYRVSNLSVHNTAERGAGPVADGATPLVAILNGERDAEAGKFLNSEGGEWPW